MFAFLLAYDYLRLEQTAYVWAKQYKFGFAPFYAILLAIPIFCALCVGPPLTGYWIQVAKYLAEVSLLVVVGAAIFLLFRVSESDLPAKEADRPGKRSAWVVAYLVLGIIAGTLVWMAFAARSQSGLLLAAIVAVSVLEMPRLTLGLRSWWRRTRSLERYPYLAAIRDEENHRDRPSTETPPLDPAGSEPTAPTENTK